MKVGTIIIYQKTSSLRGKIGNKVEAIVMDTIRVFTSTGNVTNYLVADNEGFTKVITPYEVVQIKEMKEE